MVKTKLQKNHNSLDDQNPLTPELEGEQAASGSDPDPESDDDIDKMNVQVGLKHDDMNHPKELNIAQEVNEAEEYKRTH